MTGISLMSGDANAPGRPLLSVQATQTALQAENATLRDEKDTLEVQKNTLEAEKNILQTEKTTLTTRLQNFQSTRFTWVGGVAWDYQMETVSFHVYGDLNNLGNPPEWWQMRNLIDGQTLLTKTSPIWSFSQIGTFQTQETDIHNGTQQELLTKATDALIAGNQFGNHPLCNNDITDTNRSIATKEGAPYDWWYNADNGTHAGRNDALVNFKKVNHEVHNCFTFEGTPRIVNAYYFWIIDTTSSWGMPNQWILYGSHTETPDISDPQDHPWVVLDVQYGKDSQYWQEKSNDPSYSNDSGSTDWTKAVKYCFPNDVAYKHYTLCWVGNNAYAYSGTAAYGIKGYEKIYINELALVWEPDLVFDSSYSIFGPDSP